MQPKVKVDFKNKEQEWSITLSPVFNCHLDDKKAIWKLAMKELDDKSMSNVKQFAQRARLIYR